MKYKLEDKKCIQISNKPGGHKSLERFRDGQENNIKMYL
jgi:hypothetical protein